MTITPSNSKDSEVTVIHINPPVEGELRTNGTSAKIRVSEEVTAKKLKAFGFSSNNPDRFYYFRDLGCDISFNISIDAKSLTDMKIDVLDDDFGQPYDYQAIIMERVEPGAFVIAIYEKVEAELERLREAGILVGHVRGQYV